MNCGPGVSRKGFTPRPWVKVKSRSQSPLSVMGRRRCHPRHARLQAVRQPEIGVSPFFCIWDNTRHRNRRMLFFQGRAWKIHRVGDGAACVPHPGWGFRFGAAAEPAFGGDDHAGVHVYGRARADSFICAIRLMAGGPRKRGSSPAPFHLGARISGEREKRRNTVEVLHTHLFETGRPRIMPNHAAGPHPRHATRVSFQSGPVPPDTAQRTLRLPGSQNAVHDAIAQGPRTRRGPSCIAVFRGRVHVARLLTRSGRAAPLFFAGRRPGHPSGTKTHGVTTSGQGGQNMESSQNFVGTGLAMAATARPGPGRESVFLPGTGTAAQRPATHHIYDPRWTYIPNAMLKPPPGNGCRLSRACKRSWAQAATSWWPAFPAYGTD